MAQIVNRWGRLNDEDDKFYNDLEDKYMPACGKAKTLGGEIIRAMSRIIYKYYNDGDTVDRYYSSQYNASYACDEFLCKHVPTYHSLRNVAEYNFEPLLCNRLKSVVDWLRNNMKVFEIENREDCIENAPLQDWSYKEEDDYNDWPDDNE